MTRLIFDYLLKHGWLNHIGMLHLIKNPHWDFMKWAKPAFIASWTIILVGMCYGVFVRGKSTLGIDFVGGDAIRLSYKDKVGVDKIREALTEGRRCPNPIPKGRGFGRAASGGAIRQGNRGQPNACGRIPFRELQNGRP